MHKQVRIPANIPPLVATVVITVIVTHGSQALIRFFGRESVGKGGIQHEDLGFGF